VDLPIYIGSVHTEHLNQFPDMLKASLQRIVQEGIDMERMTMFISRDERQVRTSYHSIMGKLVVVTALFFLQLRSRLESAKGDTFSGTIIADFLYGKEDGSELPISMDEINQYAALKTWSSNQWAGLLQKYGCSPSRNAEGSHAHKQILH
jgi:Zn-dependent M16 (insulinase) family peptidase